MEIPGPLYRLLKLERRLAPLRVPVRFSDGRLRLSTMRLRRLKHLWLSIPILAEESRQSFDAYAGGDVLDVGAFHGWYSVLLAPTARASDRFISFEPDSRAVPVLRATLRDLAACFTALEFEVITQPVGDGGRVLATWPSGIGAHPSFAGSDVPESEPSLTIDQVVAEKGLRPRFVKIDVEGAEWFVLHGMLNTMRQHRPTIMLELHETFQPTGIAASDVEDLMRDNDYQAGVVVDSSTIRRCLWCPR